MAFGEVIQACVRVVGEFIILKQIPLLKNGDENFWYNDEIN